MTSEVASRSLLSRLSTLHLFLLVPWIVLVVAALKPIRDNSFLWHIQAGHLQRTGGVVLTEDPFSYTFSDAPWRTQSWLADVGYSLLDGWFGLDFVPWMIAIVAAATFALMGLLAHRVSGSLPATVAALAAASWVGVAFLSPRPVLFSYLFLAVLAVALEHQRLRWTVPVVIWVWAAVHGSFVIGLAMIVLVGLARRRRFLPDLGLSAVLASLTAHGLGVWAMLWSFVQNRPALDLITEWAPPKLTNPDLAPFLLLIGVLLWGATRRTIEPTDLIVIVPFLFFGLSATRALFPAMVVLTPYAAKALSRWKLAQRTAGASPAVNLAVAVLIVGLPFLITDSFVGLDTDRFPIEEAEAIAPGPLLHDDIVGGYLIYAHPDIPVFVDDRAELYGAEHFEDLIVARNAREGWEEVFDRHGISQALLRSSDGLVSLLDLLGWERRAEGESYVLMVSPG